MPDAYILPVGLDGTKFVSDLSKIRQITTQTFDEIKRSNDSMTTGFINATKAASGIPVEMVKIANSIKDQSKTIANNNTQLLSTLDTLSKVAASQGKAFDADKLRQFSAAVKTAQSGLTDILSKGAANFDPSKLQALDKQIENVTGDAEQFKAVINFIQENLNDLKLNPEDATQLENYINLIKSAFAEFDNKPIDIPVKVDTASATKAADQIDEALQIKPTIVFSAEDVNNIINQIKEQVSSSNIDVNVLTNAVAQGTEILQSLDQESDAYKTLSASIDLANEKLNQFAGTTNTTSASIVELRNALLAKKVELVNTTDIQQAALLNKEIESLEQQIIALGNAGKTGFDNLGNQLPQVESKAQKVTQRIREITNELVGMRKGTPEFNALINEAAKLTDNLGDTRNQIRLLASDTSHLDAGVQAVQGIVGVFAAAQGAVALFGSKNEELQKTLLKVNAAMSILQGIQQVGQLLDQKSALNVFLMQTLRLKQAENTGKAAIAETGLAGAEVKQGVAAVGATSAQEGLNTAMAANPAGILLLSLGVLIGLIEIFTSDTEDAAAAQEKLNQQLDTAKFFSDDTLNSLKRFDAEKLAEMKAAGKSEQEIRDTEAQQLKDQYDVFVQRNQQTIDASKKASEQLKQIADNNGKILKEVDRVSPTGEKFTEVVSTDATDEQIKQLQATVDKGLAIQNEKNQLASQLRIKDLDNQTQNNKELDDARKKENDQAKADYDKRIAIEAAYQKALSDLIKQYRNTSIDLISNDRDKQKAQALAQLQDAEDQINQLLAQQKKAGTLTAELQTAANNEKSALERKYTNDVLKIDTDFYSKQADLLKSANDAIDEVFQTSTQRQVEQTAKKFDDLIKQLDEQNKKILSQQVITPHDATITQANVDEETRLQKAKQDAIDKIVNDSALSQIDVQKQLALDTADQIKISGANEEKLTQAKETAKVEIEKEAAQQSLKVLTDLLVKQNKLTQDQVTQLLDPANLQKAAQQKTDIFSLLGLSDSLDSDTKQKIQNFIDALNKETQGAAKKGTQFSLGDFLTKSFFGNSDEAKAFAADFAKVMSNSYNEIAKAMEDSAQRQIDSIQSVIDSLDNQISDQQNAVDEQKRLSDEGLANDLTNQQKKLDDLQNKKTAEINAQQQAQKKLEEIRKKEAIIQAASILASNIEAGVQLEVAAAEAIKAHAGIPFIGVALGLGFAALIVSTFIGIRAAIKSATSDVPKFKKGGGKDLSGRLLHGPSHEEKGIGLYNKKTGEHLAEYEGDEYLFAIKKTSTKKHLPLLNAINDDDQEKIRSLVIPFKIDPFEAMHTLRKVVRESPKPPMEEIAAVNRTAREVHTIIVQKQMGALNKSDLSKLDHLEVIERNTRKDDKPEVIDYGDYIIIKEKGRTRKIYKKRS